MAGEAKRGPPGFEGLPSERKARFLQLWEGGASADDIAAEFKISRKTVYNWGIVCGATRGSKPPAKPALRPIRRLLHLTGKSLAEADRMALAARKSFTVMLEAAVPHFWASLSAEEKVGVRALALDEFPSDWLQHAGTARLRQAEDDLREAEAEVLAGWMVEDLGRGGEAADRVIAALYRAGEDPTAQVAWREQAAALAPQFEGEAETFERQLRREAAKRSGKGAKGVE